MSGSGADVGGAVDFGRYLWCGTSVIFESREGGDDESSKDAIWFGMSAGSTESACRRTGAESGGDGFGVGVCDFFWNAGLWGALSGNGSSVCRRIVRRSNDARDGDFVGSGDCSDVLWNYRSSGHSNYGGICGDSGDWSDRSGAGIGGYDCD